MQVLIVRQQGQAMVEMIIVSFVALLLLFGIIQFALLYNAKTILNYAAFEAARAGTLNYSHPLSMRLALAQKLAALEPIKAVPGESDYQRLIDQQDNLLKGSNAKGSSLFDSVACIKRINPPVQSGHWKPNSIIPEASDGITNDHLIYRDRTLKGTPKQSIQDANLLKISVTYCPKMIVPIVSSVVKKLMVLELYEQLPSGKSFTESKIEGYVPPTLAKDSFKKQCYLAGRFPIVAQAIMRMQTPVGKYGFKDSDCDEITTLASQLGKAKI